MDQDHIFNVLLMEFASYDQLCQTDRVTEICFSSHCIDITILGDEYKYQFVLFTFLV